VEKIGLVLEGGGMRGVYTSGVLDYLMEKDFYLPYIIGVSAGACNGVAYVSKQIGRSKESSIGYIDDPMLINYKNLIDKGYLINMDLLFDEMPNKLIPFDYDAFYKSNQEFIVVTTNCRTGKPVYFRKEDCRDIMMVCRASSSLPFIAPIIEIDGEPMLDGGITDSIPVRKSIEDGNNKNVLVLTRPAGYRKKPSKIKQLVKIKYEEYPHLQEAMINRYKMYNDTLDYIDELEENGDVFVIRPSRLIKIKRMEKGCQKLIELYNLGYEDAKALYNKMLKWAQ
jgi:predicted patatin/cPLA2 family phospholipase